MRNAVRSFLSAVILVLLAFLMSGCTPQLSFNSVTVDPPTANVGDTVRIGWTYENEDLLEQQFVNLRTVTVVGVQESFQTLGPDVRETEFEFKTPVTVEIIGQDSDGVVDRVAFDISLAGDAFFNVSARAETDPQYPRLGYVTSSVEGGSLDPGETFISFQQFVGFYDPPANANGRVNSVVDLLGTQSAFRAFSLSGFESDGFNLAQGSLYPLQSPSNPGLGVSNAMIFGGGLAYSGEEFIIKSGDIFFSGRHARTITFEPIFMTISMLIGFNAGTLNITEIQFGNLEQGLVLPLFAGGSAGRGIGSFEIQGTNINNGTQAGEISGQIKGGFVGFPVTTLDNETFDALVRFDASFNMPFLFDNDLESQIVLSD